MLDLICILALIFIAVRTVSYAIWEKKYNENPSGAASVIFLATLTLAVVYRFI